MKISLNKNSWHFKLYSLVISDNPPKSLCPYFWSMVVILVFSPCFLYIGLHKLLTKGFDKLLNRKKTPKKSIFDMSAEELEEENKRLKKINRRMDITGKILMGLFVLFLLTIFGICFYFGVRKEGLFNLIRNLLSIVGFCFILYLIIDFIFKNSKKIVNSNIIKVPVAMIKAIYTKTCPIINWK